MKKWIKFLAFLLLLAVGIFVGKCAFYEVKNFLPVRIEGADNIPAGTIGVYQIANVKSADWTIIPDAEHYVDSNAGTFLFTAVEGEFRIVAAAVRRGKPVIAEKTVRIGDKSPNNDQNDGADNGKNLTPEPDTLAEWVFLERQKLTDESQKILGEVFLGVCQKVDAQEISTVAGTLAAVREGVLVSGVTDCDAFLDEFGKRIQKENPQTAADAAGLLRLFVPASAALPEEPAAETVKRRKYW